MFSNFDYYQGWKQNDKHQNAKCDHNEFDWQEDCFECDWEKDPCKHGWEKDNEKHGKCEKHKTDGFTKICNRFANILESEILPSPRGVCTVTRMRDIDVEIKGRPTHSPLVLNALFSFESPDKKGRTLNLGETVILQKEINPFITALRAQGIEVTALHNHWLFDNPRLFYIHFLSVEEPLTFAKKVAKAFTILENCD